MLCCVFVGIKFKGYVRGEPNQAGAVPDTDKRLPPSNKKQNKAARCYSICSPHIFSFAKHLNTTQLLILLFWHTTYDLLAIGTVGFDQASPSPNLSAKSQ